MAKSKKIQKIMETPVFSMSGIEVALANMPHYNTHICPSVRYDAKKGKHPSRQMRKTETRRMMAEY